MLKQINGFDAYYVDDTGVVYSNKSGYLKPISQWKDGKGRYLLVHIVNNDGKAKNVFWYIGLYVKPFYQILKTCQKLIIKIITHKTTICLI